MRSYIKLVILVFIMCSFLLLPKNMMCWAEDTLSMLALLSNKFENVNSYSAEVKVRLSNGEMDVGKIYYMKPDIYRYDHFSKDDGSLRMVGYVKDGILWWYMPALNQAIKWPKKQSPDNIYEKLLKTTNNLDTLSNLVIEKRQDNGNEYYLISITYHKTIKVMDLLVDAKTCVIKEIFIYDEKGHLKSIEERSNFDFNVKLDKSFFSFEPPEGCAVSDMTQQNSALIKKIPINVVGTRERERSKKSRRQ